MTFAKRRPVLVCSECYQSRLLSEMLEVTNVASGRLRLICRPQVNPGCFGNLPPRSIETVAMPQETAP